MEFMYSKGHLQPNALDPNSAEKMAEILFEIGKDLSKKENFSMAVRWLERGYDIINAQDLSLLSRDAIELRLSIYQALIHALLGLGTPESSQKALDLVSYIESEIGEKPVVLLLRLEFLQKTPAEVFDVEAYADILRRMVRSFNFSEAHFKLLVHHARKLHDKSPTLATSVVDGMLRGTIVSSGREEWVERLVLLRIWMETTQRDGMRAIEELMGALEGLQNNLNKPFGASTAVGALTVSLIWGRWKTRDADICAAYLEKDRGQLQSGTLRLRRWLVPDSPAASVPKRRTCEFFKTRQVRIFPGASGYAH